MGRKKKQEMNHDRFLIELMLERRDDRDAFLREMAAVIFKTDSPIEIAQEILQVGSPLDVALAALQVDSPLVPLQVDSPLFAVQKILQVDSLMSVVLVALQATSPEEVSPKLAQIEKQVKRLHELIRKQNLEKAKA